MSWQSSYVLTTRILIQDLSSTPEFSEERLLEILVVAAQQVQMEFGGNFLNYSITLCPSPDIDPDPTDAPDNVFLNFVTLKAACLIDRGSMRAQALVSDLTAKLGPVSMATGGRMQSFVDLIANGYCKAYQELKDQYLFGNAASVRVILTPFINSAFDPLYGIVVGDYR